MKKYTYFLFFLFLLSCRTNYRTYNNENYIKADLPGIVKLPDGSMMDETEITNLDWREYMYWTQRIYGMGSPEHNSTLPNENSWIQTDTSYFFFTLEYLRSPAYQYYPVVGISQNQAEAFSKWRSDRVFEYILIASGLIEWTPNPGPDDHFTIERYFNGEYLDKKVDSNHIYYPVYTLPSYEDWKYANRVNDSLLKAEIKTSGFTKKQIYSDQLNFIRCGYGGITYDSSYTEAAFTLPVKGNYLLPENSLYQLKGNVSEWICVPNTTIGGGWYNARSEILKDTIFQCDSSNAWTGFRNTAHWEKWTK